MEMTTIDYGDAIKRIAELISIGNIYEARQIAKAMPSRIKKAKVEGIKYKADKTLPNSPNRNYKGKEALKLKVFIRDGFIDRYTNLRVVVPPVLRLISEIIPLEFPFHPNWAEGICHSSYYDLSATVDHLIPIAQNGTDDFDNLITTSMSKNTQKHSISIEDLGWEIYDCGNLKVWDRLCKFYLEQCDKNPGLLKHSYFKQWHNAIKNNIGIIFLE